MTLEKSKLKKVWLDSEAEKADERATVLEGAIPKLEGMKAGFEAMGAKIPVEISSRLKTEMDEGVIDEETGKAIARYLKTCTNMAVHLAANTASELGLTYGRAKEARDRVAVLRKEASAEEAKAKALKDSEKKSNGKLNGKGRRATGVRPTSLKQQRAKPAKKKARRKKKR